MPSLSLLELLALGDDLPPDWRDLTHQQPDEQPLLFRWVEFVRVPPQALVLHFLVPLEWRDVKRELVVVPWSGNSATHGANEQLVIPGLILPYFRLYRTVEGQALPRPLQMVHPHLNLDLRKAG